MRLFKNKWFSRYARRTGIEDVDLCHAVDRANQGMVDADLDGGVIKQRIARPNEGKSSGFRTIVLFRTGDFAFFAYGFAKNERSNIQSDELKAFKKLAAELLSYDETALTQAINAAAITEVFCDAEGEDVREEVRNDG